jgi:hypothetical protein
MEKQNDLGFMSCATRFPSLGNAVGIMPWNPNQLDIWTAEYGRDIQAVHSARFILEAWHPWFAWECGKFDPKVALASWDIVHRRVYLDLVTQDLNYSA